jgi:hypothetical protein
LKKLEGAAGVMDARQYKQALGQALRQGLQEQRAQAVVVAKQTGKQTEKNRAYRQAKKEKKQSKSSAKREEEIEDRKLHGQKVIATSSFHFVWMSVVFVLCDVNCLSDMCTHVNEALRVENCSFRGKALFVSDGVLQEVVKFGEVAQAPPSMDKWVAKLESMKHKIRAKQAATPPPNQ